MKRPVVVSWLVLAGICATGVALASGKAHWGYSGTDGPEHWGKLDPTIAACAAGKNQSPIDLTGMVEGSLPEIQVRYKPGGREIVNNGHTIRVNYTPGSTISVAGQVFELKQFHFHSPSENTIEGAHYAMEGPFVHADKDGNLAVVAVMFNKGAENSELEKAWAHMPAKAGHKQVLASADRCRCALASQPRLLPFQRLTDYPALQRRCVVAGCEAHRHRVEGADREIH